MFHGSSRKTCHSQTNPRHGSRSFRKTGRKASRADCRYSASAIACNVASAWYFSDVRIAAFSSSLSVLNISRLSVTPVNGTGTMRILTGERGHPRRERVPQRVQTAHAAHRHHFAGEH